jgi:hypothetical protein
MAVGPAVELSGDWGTLRATGVHLVDADGAVREVCRLRYRGLRGMLDPWHHDFVAVTCWVIAGGRHPRHVGPQQRVQALPPRPNLLRQLERAAIDANRGTQPLTLRRHPHHHSAPPVQIYPDTLPAAILIHRGLLRRGGREHPRRTTHLGDCHEERRPRSLIASGTLLTVSPPSQCGAR